MKSATNQLQHSLIQKFAAKRGLVFSVMLVGALLSFEVFNFSTTDFALNDLLGNLRFVGIRWSTILALAFCGIDFAGIARLFTPEEGSDESPEIWYLFGAWLLAATMNALLTWWGVSIAVLNHQSLGNALITRDSMLTIVPVFVAVMVWLSRILIIGTFSVAGERLFTTAENASSLIQPTKKPVRKNYPSRQTDPSYSGNFRPALKPKYIRNPEPSYQPLPLSAKSRTDRSIRK